MLGGIGDTLVATPAIHALRRRYPAARLTVIVRQEGRCLVDGSADVDEVLPFRSGSRLRKLRFLATLAFRRWDLWVDLHAPTFNTVTSNAEVFRRNRLMMRAAWTRHRVGFAVPDLVAHLSHPVPVPPLDVLSHENIAETTLRVAGGGVPLRKRLPPAGTGMAEQAETLARAHGAGDAPRLALFFGSNQPSDVWPAPELERFCRLLCAELPRHRFLVLGGPKEGTAAEALLAALGDAAPRFVNLAGAATLAQTAALLARCDGLVSTDSGPMHMADALGIPLVAVFSSKNHTAIWAPTGDRHVVLNKAVPCGPCFRNVCDKDNLCLRLIEAPEVMAAVRRVLA